MNRGISSESGLSSSEFKILNFTEIFDNFSIFLACKQFFHRIVIKQKDYQCVHDYLEKGGNGH